ncbi:hypothetical protein CEXT_90701 [Caerostris extrusa]|uniref:Uncharacterized protein n=1 Tax=Caerostris extrusa TaxID=172846 RepID=A0AAV4Q5V2_CAEEX|nr:hypothetical protein CEXT_90701 [Caerostris extrusa]
MYKDCKREKQTSIGYISMFRYVIVVIDSSFTINSTQMKTWTVTFSDLFRGHHTRGPSGLAFLYYSLSLNSLINLCIDPAISRRLTDGAAACTNNNEIHSRAAPGVPHHDAQAPVHRPAAQRPHVHHLQELHHPGAARPALGQIQHGPRGENG